MRLEVQDPGLPTLLARFDVENGGKRLKEELQQFGPFLGLRQFDDEGETR